MLLSRQRVVAARRRLDAVLADEAAVEGEVLHAGGELVAGDVGVVRGEWLQRAEPGVEVGVALDVRLPGGGDAAACQLRALVGECGLPVFFAEGGVQARAEVAAEGGLPLWRDVQMVKQLRRGGEFGRLFGRRVLVFLQGGKGGLLSGGAGLCGAGLGLEVVVLLLRGGEGGGGLRDAVFEGKQGFGEGVVLGLQGLLFEVVAVVGRRCGGGEALFEAVELGLGFAEAVRGAVVAVFGVVAVFALRVQLVPLGFGGGARFFGGKAGGVERGGALGEFGLQAADFGLVLRRLFVVFVVLLFEAGEAGLLFARVLGEVLLLLAALFEFAPQLGEAGSAL